MSLRDAALEGLALVVPPRCSICAESCAATAAICADCRDALARAPLGSQSPARRSAFDYSGIARDAVRALKFGSRPALAGELARLTAARLPPAWGAGAVLVPVPAHPASRRARGYNQAQLLARELARTWGVPLVDCLRRASAGAPQSSLSRAQRLAMPRDAIRIKSGAYRQVGGRTSAQFPTNVLLCDDVVTTGVTLEVCADVLRESRPDLTLQIRAVTFASTGAQKGQSAQKNTGHG